MQLKFPKVAHMTQAVIDFKSDHLIAIFDKFAISRQTPADIEQRWNDI